MTLTVPRAAVGARRPGPGAVPRGGRSGAALRLLVLAAALLGVLLGGAAPASAHAALTDSSPAQGAVLQKAPAQVALSFSEGVSMGDDSIRVLDPKGKRIDRGKLLDLCSGSTVKYGTGLPPGLPDGTYTVAWQAVSADSHPVSGAFTFSVGAPSESAAVVPQQDAGGGLVGALYGIARYVAYAAFALLVGGACFVLACRPSAALGRPVQRLVVWSWATLTAATIVLLLLRTPYTGSGDLADVFDLGGLKAVLTTKPGAALVSRVLLLAAAALFMAVLFGAYARAEEEGDTKRRKDLTFGLGVGGAVVAAGLAATWAMAEHASTGLQTAVAMPVDVVHLLAVAVWLGGLAALLVSLYRGPAIERAAVQRFSRLAFAAVLVLVVTGVYQSWRQVGTWRALTDTSYGQLLLVKVGLVVVLVGVAWFSRRWTGRLADATDGAGAAQGAAAGGFPAQQSVPETVAATAESRAAQAGPESAANASSEGAANTAPGSTTNARSEDTANTTPRGTMNAASKGTANAALEGTASAPSEDTADASPERAAQLARQRAAVADARRKRVRDADPVRYGLRRSVLAETGVAVVLLAVTTVLTTTEPARTEQAVRDSGQFAEAARPVSLTVPFDTLGPKGKGTARLDLDPARAGQANVLHLRISDPDGAARDVPEVRVSFTSKAKNLGPLPAALKRTGTGHWTARGVQLPTAGTWQLSLVVRTSDIDQVTETRNVKISS
ncbi:copper resistance CopC/CopD family protein [Streptomyces niger]|uniref:copper resistance CopC/CopD family protein n=1 Tax=Streptomyces niger TaxID=66373 RepID=UPI000AD4F074|nr:copper resistance protein CopC [Streptomyces niger]